MARERGEGREGRVEGRVPRERGEWRERRVVGRESGRESVS